MFRTIFNQLSYSIIAVSLGLVFGCSSSSPNSSGSEPASSDTGGTPSAGTGGAPDVGTGGTPSTGMGGTPIGAGGARPGSGGSESLLCKTINDDSGDTDASTIASILGAAAASCDIEPSSYDRSCQVDSDCTAVGFGNLCEVPCGVQCANSAINVGALAKYQDDYAKNPAAACGRFFCGCPAEGVPTCVKGVCELPFGVLLSDAGSSSSGNDAGPSDAGSDHR